MVKFGLVIVVGLVGVTLAYPVAQLQENDSNVANEVTPRQAGALAGIFGSIGTALVPVFGAVFGPILTNLAQGIAAAFNNGLKVSSNQLDVVPVEGGAEALIVRIPPNSPLFQALAAAQAPTSDADESALPKPKNPFNKFGAVRTNPSDPAPVHVDDDGDVTGGNESAALEHSSPVRRHQVMRTETDYA